MALIKKHKEQVVETLPKFEDLDAAIAYFEVQTDSELLGYAIGEIIKFESGGSYLVKVLKEESTTKESASRIASLIGQMDHDKAPIEEVMELLKLSNAYVRNLGITILQGYGGAIKYYIVKFLIGDDRDLRIFAINVLGDVNFSESRDMLVELLQKEEDINVAMTAVDYMAEIGEVEDIPLLESIKARFNNDAYVVFGVENAISGIKG